MAGEGDQTKWVGVRPTNPAEAIPTTESAPLASIKVEPKTAATVFKTAEQAPLTDILVAPSAGSPEFLTLTKKRAPAITDLQAISGFVREFEVVNNVGVNPYLHDLYEVPAGKIFMLQAIATYCYQATPTWVYFILRKAPTDYTWYMSTYGGAYEIHTRSDNILYDEGEILRIKWGGIGATDDVWASCFGYLLTKY